MIRNSRPANNAVLPAAPCPGHQPGAGAEQNYPDPSAFAADQQSCVTENATAAALSTMPHMIRKLPDQVIGYGG